MTLPVDDDEDGGELLTVVVEEAFAGQRLDAVIAATTALSRVAAQRLIEATQSALREDAERVVQEIVQRVDVPL